MISYCLVTKQYLAWLMIGKLPFSSGSPSIED
jgi:hypothetical protein